jgi:hypothetical protein
MLSWLFGILAPIASMQPMYIYHNVEARSRNHCYRGKAISNTYLYVCACVRARANVCPGGWVCACACVHVALLILHATRMRYIVTFFVARLTLPNFSTLSHKRHDFRKSFIEHKMCVLIFYTTIVFSVSHSKNNSVRYCHKCEYVFM